MSWLRHCSGWSALLATMLATALALTACRRGDAAGPAFDKRIREPSGVVFSRQHEGVIWTHGDSGTGNWLYAVERSGSLIAQIRVEGASNVDWEDIAQDQAGNLWIGDIGNNQSARHDLAVYRIPEPDPRSASSVTVDRRVAFRYPDQHEFFVPKGNFDSESLLWWRDSLWLLTKRRGDSLTKLYRFPELRDGAEVVLEEIASFDLGASLGEEHSRFPTLATAADINSDGTHWALLTYDAAFVFAVPEHGDELFAELVNRIAFDAKVTQQVEALAWDGRSLYLVNEDREVFEIAEPLTQARFPSEK